MKPVPFRSLLIPFLALTFVLTARGSWLDNQAFSRPEEKTATSANFKEMKTKDGFTAQFWLIRDDALASRWFQVNVRKMNIISATRKQNPVLLALFFVNPAHREGFVQSGGRVTKMQISDVTFDLTVIRPDGVEDKHFGVPALHGETPPPYLLKIAQAKVQITFDVEPIGLYKMKVVVHDNVRKVDIPLERELRVSE